jgi:hypothetical protein
LKGLYQRESKNLKVLVLKMDERGLNLLTRVRVLIKIGKAGCQVKSIFSQLRNSQVLSDV